VTRMDKATRLNIFYANRELFKRIVFRSVNFACSSPWGKITKRVGEPGYVSNSGHYSIMIHIKVDHLMVIVACQPVSLLRREYDSVPIFQRVMVSAP
jgi:hypothetical protein